MAVRVRSDSVGVSRGASTTCHMHELTCMRCGRSRGQRPRPLGNTLDGGCWRCWRCWRPPAAQQRRRAQYPPGENTPRRGGLGQGQGPAYVQPGLDWWSLVKRGQTAVGVVPRSVAQCLPAQKATQGFREGGTFI